MQRFTIYTALWAILICVTISPAKSQTNGTTLDRLALLQFKAETDGNGKLGTWKGLNHCSGHWLGVSCTNNRVTHLVLEGLQLRGSINSLSELHELRILSLDNNFLNGTIPNLTNWRYLRSLYLSNNEFQGPIPDSVSVLWRLWRIDLSNNMLNGSIPSSFNFLSNLLTLNLQNNKLSGTIPSLSLPNLKAFNVSDNQLSGEIPVSLSNFSVSSFLGNENLCGSPLLLCGGTGPDSVPLASSPVSVIPLTANSHPKTRSMKLSVRTIIAIVVADVAVVVLITWFIILYYLRKYSRASTPTSVTSSKKKIDPEKLLSNYPQQEEVEKRKLVFIDDDSKQFELDDLLRASAEMLGKGGFGTAYKAILKDGRIVAVKRLNDAISCGRKEFEQHMEQIGKLRHHNIVSLRAYCYAKDEKLLVYEYMPSGNLYSLLHGNRGPGRTPLDWTTRVKITLGAARGLAFIHHQGKGAKLCHGNIKSSNILLDKDGNACISDFGLFAMVNSPVVASRLIKCKAPEYYETKKMSQAMDVYGFGLLLLEILTGKAPNQDDGVDLPKWVHAVLQGQWTAEVFDVELLRYKHIEEEMLSMLNVAMTCVSKAPDHRPRMTDVVKMIEDIVGEQQSFQRGDSFDSISMSPSFSEDTGTSH